MPARTIDGQLIFFHDADVLDRTPAGLGGLAADRDILVPAYPGFEGQFEALERGWERWDSASDLAHHFRGLVHAKSGRPVHLAGAGFGGWVALELALLEPHTLASLVLVSPYGVKLFDRMEPDFADILLLDAHEQIELSWADPARCSGIRMPGYPEDLPDSQHEIAFAERATLARYGWKPFMHSRGLSRWFETIDVPTLVLVGAEDRMLHSGHSQTLAQRLPNAHYVEIPDAGHYPYLEQPEAFRQAVLGFYSELEGFRL